MSLLGKKAPSDELMAQISALTEQNEALMAQVSDLTAYRARQESINQLSTKSKELGFTGDVSALFDEANGDMVTAMGSMITAFTQEVATRKVEFVETSAEEDEGDSLPDVVDEKPATKNSAMALVKSNYNLSGAAAVRKAQELFPLVMGGK
jgi:hypothetical protein